ncbi:MAG: DUF3782 domain-containing protein [Candidatus Bathyarchaeia archaeon]
MIEINELKSRFLRLLKEDEEFRYAVAGYIGLAEILRRLEEHDKKFNEILARLDRHEEMLIKHSELFEKHWQEIVKLREDMLLGFRRHDEEMARLREDMNRGFMLLERHISALGARWGLMAEEAFREGLRGLLSRELGLIVERWKAYDESGRVFGYPSEVEIDIAVRDGKVILIEVASHAKASDIYQLKRKAELYVEKTGKRPDRLLIVTPYIDEKALEASKQLNIEVYTKV